MSTPHLWSTVWWLHTDAGLCFARWWSARAVFPANAGMWIACAHVMVQIYSSSSGQCTCHFTHGWWHWASCCTALPCTYPAALNALPQGGNHWVWRWHCCSTN